MNCQRAFRFSLLFLLLLSVTAGCREDEPEQFTIVTLNRYTPVKSQGRSPHCWIYAMLAAIETEHIMQGDSVNLSPAFVEVMAGRDKRAPKPCRATAHTLLSIIARDGLVPFDAMRDTLQTVPRWAFMYGMQYTLQEFARSVCAPREWLSITTDATHTWGDTIVPSWPDNWERAAFLNLPSDSLLALARRAVKTGHGACWEGEISKGDFDFRRGVARLRTHRKKSVPPRDDHCMAIVGTALDSDSVPYFIMKNSWGKGNPYGGLMFLSEEYFLQKTVALYVPRKVAEGNPPR